MTTGQRFQHRHSADMECVIIEPTKKGARVLLQQVIRKRVKSSVQFFSDIDFDKEKGLWTPKPEVKEAQHEN